MAVNLKGRSFLTLADFTPAEIRYLLDLGHDLKAKRRSGICAPTMQGKHIVLLFEKTSTRTRCSFEVAATQEGAHVTYLDANSSQMGKKESLEDSAKVLILRLAAEQYAALGNEEYETNRLRRLFSAFECVAELNADLLKNTVSEVLVTRQNVKLRLKNGQVIERSDLQ